MTTQDIGHFLGDVSLHFKHPDDIASNRDFSRQQKIKLLRQWEHDLQLLLVASEENMTGSGASQGQTGETLKVVVDALNDLEAERPAGPAKVG